MPELDPEDAARQDAANIYAVVGLSPGGGRDPIGDCSRHPTTADAIASAVARPAGRAYTIINTETGEDVSDLIVSSGEEPASEEEAPPLIPGESTR